MSIEHKNAVKVCRKFFAVEELFSPDLVAGYPSEWLWNQIDTQLLKALVWIRVKYDAPIFVNNWHSKGDRVASGFRAPQCKVGALLSGHRSGRCLDLHATDIPRLRKVCLECPLLTEIEAEVLTPTWVHISTRPHMEDGLRIITA